MTRDALAASTARAVLFARLIHLLYHALENPTLRNTITPVTIGNVPKRWRLSVAVAHIVDTHSCRPGLCPSHRILFTGCDAQSVARWGCCPISHLFRAKRSRARARNSDSLLGRFPDMFPLPAESD